MPMPMPPGVVEALVARWYVRRRQDRLGREARVQVIGGWRRARSRHVFERFEEVLGREGLLDDAPACKQRLVHVRLQPPRDEDHTRGCRWGKGRDEGSSVHASEVEIAQNRVE